MSLLDEIKKRAQSAVKTYTQQDDVQKRLNDYAASNKVSTYSDVKNTVKQAFQPVLNIVDNVRSKPAENWYKGDQPTRRETLARIYDISAEDASRGESLFNMYEAELSDPTSPFYNPYTQATTSKANKTNLANTAKAQEEWARLSDELSYWATRSDRNYSDDEIIARIDWDNYKTLQKMDEGRRSGSPLALTEAVGYSEDAMYGVLWAARNPEAATGDAMMDAAQSAMGRGKQHKASGVSAYLDATSDYYSPYKAGATALDDLAYKYGMPVDFDEAWLFGDGRVLVNGDEESQKDYARIYDTVMETNEYRADVAALNKSITAKIEAGMSPDEIFNDSMFDAFPKAKELYESQRRGILKDTSGAVDFSLMEMYEAAEKAYADRMGRVTPEEYNAEVVNTLGSTDVASNSAKVVKPQTAEQLRASRSIFAPYATEMEKRVLQSIDPSYGEVKANVKNGVLNGSAGSSEAYKAAMTDADDFAAQNYLTNLAALRTLQAEKESLQQYQSFYDKWLPKLDADPVNTMSDPEYVAESEAIQDAMAVWDKYAGDATAIDAAIAEQQKLQQKILSKYADAELLNESGYAGSTMLPMLNFIDQFNGFEAGSYSTPTYEWETQLDSGADWGKVKAGMSQQLTTNALYLIQLDTAIQQAELYGVPENYIDGMQNAKDMLIAENTAIQYGLVRDNADFSAKVKEFDDTQEPFKRGLSNLFERPTREEIIKTTIIDPVQAVKAFGDDGADVLAGQMSESEKETYKYLYMAEGEERATAYYESLSPQLNARGYESMIEQAQVDGLGEGAGKTLASIFINAGSVFPLMSNAIASLNGEKLDPYSPTNWLTAYSGEVRASSKKAISDAFKDNPILDKVANFAYDAATTAADSTTAAFIGGSKAGSLFLMGASAAQSTLMDASARGAEGWQAWALAGAAAAAETLTEYLPTGNLFEAFELGGTAAIKELGENIIKGIASDAPGEMVSEFLNGVTDDLIMQEMSNSNLRIQQLMAEYKIGYDEASAIVQHEAMTNILYAGLLSVGTTVGTSTSAFAGGKVMDSLKAKRNPAMARAAGVLSRASNGGSAEKAATISGVLEGMGAEPDTADAVAQTAVSENADAADAVRGILLHSEDEAVLDAIEIGTMVPESQTGQVLAEIQQNGATDENAAALVEAAKQDREDPAVLDQLDGAVLEHAEGAASVKAMMGNTAAYEAVEKAEAEAKKKLDAAQGEYDKAKAYEVKASADLGVANHQFNNNPADDTFKAAMLSAIETLDAAQEASVNAEQALNNAKIAYDDAYAEAERQRQNLVSAARSQAEQYVGQRAQEIQAARTEKEAAAEVKRQNDNVLAMQADDFVNEYMANAPDDVKDQVRERYMAYDGETQNATRGMVEFASQISKKFNLNITFTDSHGIFEGAYKGGNTIVLDKNATQGEVIQRVLVHEITHAAESSKAYDALADAVLGAYYEGNTDQMNADLAAIAQQYSEQAGQDGQSVSRSELVAQRLSEMLSGNQDALNRLVAEKPDVATRIWRAIKEFIGKLRGVRDPEMDKLMKLEKQLEKALGSRTASTSGTQFLIERGAGGVGVVVVEEDILDGVSVRDWPKVVRSVMVSRFPDGVPVGNNVIRINRDTRKEVTNSKDTMWLKHNDFSAYQDKLRATANSDEIIKASRDYVNEAPAHERKDRIVDFARGEVSMRIGGKEYDAEVVVGYDLDGSMRLYDFVRMTRTDEKKAGQPFEDEPSRDSRAGLSELSVSENGSLVKQVSDGTEIIRGGVTKFSLTSWTEKEKTEVRKNLIQSGYGPANVDQWIDNVNSVAAIITGDKARLDYTSDPDQVMLKNNQEYVKTLDASTLCAKRLLYQGTFNEIQHMLPNTVITSDMLLDLLNMMKDAGYESPCGVCYVESRRRHLGKFAEQWLNGRPKTKEQKAWEPYSGDYIPTLDELTTTDGLAKLKAEHPQTYNDFMKKMASLGSSNPKIVELRTDYRGDIRKITKSQRDKIEKIGGLRVQSFSDFETPHLIDMMQAVLDMAGKKLTSQAYTKVPNFAWVFGDTGIKINLSLLAEGTGLDENGNLIFSSSEGMDFEEAMRLRDRYSKNVGTIIVGANDAHIRAAMADPRIDYIIPFHRSGWGQNELKKVGVLQTYTDYQANQNERMLDGSKPEGGNFYPIDYWDYSKTGDENAAIYLRMCEEDGRIPKFEQFLEKDADGHWVAPSGYWKMLIDFKMYDNDGNGAPQQTVQPNFNMEEAVRVLDEYEGGADSLPVAYDIADRFVSEYKASNPGVRFSLPSNDILDQRIAQHRNSQLAPAPNDIIPSGGEQEQNYGDGERQFAGQTIQNSAVVPDWIKQEFLRPEELNYETDTNREQVERSWQRIQENGYEAERERLLSLDRYSADDTAEANLMMAMALREDTADPATFMALASHYNKEGTKAGQELQARKLFTRMSPTGARVWAAGQMESNLEEHMRTHRSQRERVDNAARRVADQIRDMQGGDELLRLNAGGDFTIDESNNRWGVPINEQQQALIDHYGLNNVARPGIFYNRATTQQRMLEAILATPNPLEVTGLGLNLIQRLEFMQDGEAVITNADLNYIGTQLGQFVAQGGDEGGRGADLAVSRAYEAYGNITPSTTREKLRTWRYVSMLLSVPSAIRNVIGNTSQNVVNATAHGIAVELDKAIARATGQRTVEHLNYQERIDGWRGFVEETQNTFRDYFIDRSVTQRGNDKYNTNQRGRVYQTQFIETMRNVEGFLMSFGDRNTWRKAYLNSLAEQQKLADRNLLFNDDGTTRTHEQMLEQAEADANYATFTEDNAVSNVLSQLKNIPGVGEVIDFIMPFTGVPTNITRRMIQYSPIGLAATALRHGYRAAAHQNFDQRAFVDGVSRGLTGTAMFGVGMLLAAAGVIKPGTGDEDDDKKYGLMTAMGGQYTPYVYNPLTDEYVSLAAFAPAASPLTMGLAAYEEFRNNEDWLQALINASFSGADQIFDASYMSGVQDIFKGYGSPAENITNAVFSNAVSQSVPALLTQLSNTIDPYVRDTKDKNAIVQALKSGLINRIPGLRQMLPEKVDVTGQTVRTKEGLRNFYDPFTTTDVRKDPAVDELFRLSEALGSSSMLPSDALSGSKMTLNVPSNGKVTVDAEGKETYRKRYGELWLEGGTTIDKNGRPVVVEGVRSLINSSAYQMMDDEERSDAIADIIYEAKIGAMMEALNKYGAD